MIDSKYYNEEKREIITFEDVEYIIDDYDETKMNLFKKLRLGVNDNKDHYSIVIIENMEEYMAQFINEEEVE